MQQSSHEAIPFYAEHSVLYSAARTALNIFGEYSLFLRDLIPTLLQGERTPYQTKCRDNIRLDLTALPLHINKDYLCLSKIKFHDLRGNYSKADRIAFRIFRLTRRSTMPASQVVIYSLLFQSAEDISNEATSSSSIGSFFGEPLPL
jgi:hypothetical protein